MEKSISEEINDEIEIAMSMKGQTQYDFLLDCFKRIRKEGEKSARNKVLKFINEHPVDGNILVDLMRWLKDDKKRE